MHQEVLSSPLFSFGPHEPVLASTTIVCPFLGEIFPPPINVTTNPIWQDAAADLNELIDGLSSRTPNSTSLAVQIVSLNEETPIFEYYTTADGQVYGQDDHTPVDGDAVFRIASTSKMLAVYALLLECGFDCFNDAITKYMPELKDQYHGDDTTEVDWEEVGIGALASHMAGIGRDYALGDAVYSQLKDVFGLPNPEHINETYIPKCGATWALPSCDRKGTVDLLLNTIPTFANYHTPAYSNMAFQLLGYVIESITGNSFEDVMVKSVFEPLGMLRSSVSPPINASIGVRIPGDPLFDWNYGDQAPFGGIFASTNDLTRHARAVLNSAQLTPSQTRRWLRPVTHSASLTLSFGMPWEIYRKPGLGSQHHIDVYCKAGNIGFYSTQYCLIPDLQVAFTVNALANPSGSPTNAFEVSNLIGNKILEPLTKVAKQQAIATFAGRYVHSTSDTTSSLVLSADDSIGLVIEEWINNGTDLLGVLETLRIISGRIRLFPASLSSKKHGDTEVEKIAFRAVILNPEYNPFEGCINWATVDGFRYAGLPMDAFIFEVETSADGGARATAVQLPAYRATYGREQ